MCLIVPEYSKDHLDGSLPVQCGSCILVLSVPQRAFLVLRLCELEQVDKCLGLRRNSLICAFGMG